MENSMKKSGFCANCRQQLIPIHDLSNPEEEENNEPKGVYEINLDIEETVEEIKDVHLNFQSRQGSRSVKVKEALSAIYKLCVIQDNFLGSDEDVGVCQRCASVLTKLYKFYEEFNQMRQIDTYLSKNIEQLNEIIESHAQIFSTLTSNIVKCEIMEIREDVSVVEKEETHDTPVTSQFILGKRRLSSQSSQDNSKNTTQDSLGPGPWIRLSRLRPEEISEPGIATTEFDSRSEDYGGEEENLNDDATHTRNAIYSRTKKRKVKHRKKDLIDDDFQIGDDIYSRTKKRKVVKGSKKLPEKSVTEDEDDEKPNAEGRIICPFCPKTFARKYERNRHLVTHKGETDEAYKSCPKCRQVFLNQVQLNKHLRRHERPNYCFGKRLPSKKAEDAEKDLETKTNDTNNVEVSTMSDPDFFNELSSSLSKFDDDDDDDFFLDKPPSLKSKSSSQEMSACRICNAAFKRKNDLKRHMERHEGDNLFNCSDCPKIFITKEELDKHFLRHMGGTPYKCEFQFCEKAFSNSYKLKTHMKLSHPDSCPFRCDTCGRTFAFAPRLKRHQLLHTGIKPHLCQHCGKTFAVYGDMMRHSMIHSDEKPFSCDKCPLSFGRSSHLKRHRLIHTKEKPHLCPTCGFTCSLASTLKRHIQTHTGEKPYKCDKCDQSFPDKRPLIRHMTTHDPPKGDLTTEELMEGTSSIWSLQQTVTLSKNDANDLRPQWSLPQLSSE